MNRIFAAYCIFMVAILAVANHEGYVFSTLFEGQAQAGKAANHYHK